MVAQLKRSRTSSQCFGRALVPQVAPVEREAEGVVFAPDQAAQQAIAERDGFVPGLDGRLELRVEGRVGQACGCQRERQSGGQKKEWTVHSSVSVFLANCFARRIAASMLEGLALPWPAMS